MKTEYILSASACLFVTLATVSFADNEIGAKDLYKVIPENKALNSTWVESLTQRGAALEAPIEGNKQDDTLKFIGMPVGGIACGTVYLGGDGRLFIWDIFNRHHEGVVKQTVPVPQGFKNIATKKKGVRERDGASFLNPPTPDTFPPSFAQGFGMKLADGSFRSFESKDWEQVHFQGRWPEAIIRYTDKQSPISVDLSAFSPFIPLNLKDSSLPVTIMEYTLVNSSSATVKGSMCSWLENPLKKYFKNCASTTLHYQQLKVLYHHAEDPAMAGMCLGVLEGGTDFTISGHPGLEVAFSLAPGEKKTVSFILSWYLPNTYKIPGMGNKKRHYSARFHDALDVAKYVSENYGFLTQKTRLWVKTWNDSTLPPWLLDRTFLTLDTLQTANCFIFSDGQFWAWEGIGACPGTCTHVWTYAQSMARIFPSLERNLREVTDFGMAQKPDGSVPFRIKGKVAIDGQCGTVLRSYREHMMSADSQFLKRNWPAIKKALTYLIDFDRNDGNWDGLLDGKQHNTLDAEWYGKVHALCSLYIASLRAGENMAQEVHDSEFEMLCKSTYDKGRVNIEQLFNGEFYEQLEDPKHLDAIGVGKGCYIDQVIGQSWAHQLGMGQLYNKEHIQSALNSLWKYNFLTDVGPFRKVFKKGRFYAMPGDGGLLMCTWPNGGLRDDFSRHWQYAYFNECMSGFEYQVAAHMVSEGTPEMVMRGLAITRTIHDRYAPKKRNPYNEIECSDHYARAMSSYGVFIAACGFKYHGPKGHMAFSPKLSPDHFKAAFTSAKGWGSFSQTRTSFEQKARINVQWGSLHLRSLELDLPDGAIPEDISARYAGKNMKLNHSIKNNRITILFAKPVNIESGQTVDVQIALKSINKN